MYLIVYTKQDGSVDMEFDPILCETKKDKDNMIDYYCDETIKMFRRDRFKYIQINKKDLK